VEIVFWLSLFLLVLIYVGYPLLLWLLSKLFAKAKAEKVEQKEFPAISIIIPAFNEESCILDTIENKLSADYPQDKIQIIVVSDESTDKTDEIVEQLIAKNTHNIQLIKQIPRQGKTAGVNKAVKVATGEILIFSDANSIYQPDALTKLVQTFEDPSVGYVTGQLLYQTTTATGVSLGCSSYMQYENFLRLHESNLGSVVGVDGGVDSMRKSLFTELNADQLPDFVQPLSVVEKRHRVVYQPEAVMVEDALSDTNKEMKMRVRVSLRAMWALWDKRKLFNPFKYGVFSVQLLIHKLFRYLAFVPQVTAFISNMLLLEHGEIYQVLAVGQVAFYLLALVGVLLTKADKKLPTIVYLPYYLNLLNYACLLAFIQFVQGNKIVVWKPREG